MRLVPLLLCTPSFVVTVDSTGSKAIRIRALDAGVRLPD